MLPKSGETRRSAQPGRPGTASSVVRARWINDNDVSKGAAPIIVGEEKVHAPVCYIHAGAGQEVALLAAARKPTSVTMEATASRTASCAAVVPPPCRQRRRWTPSASRGRLHSQVGYAAAPSYDMPRPERGAIENRSRAN